MTGYSLNICCPICNSSKVKEVSGDHVTGCYSCVYFTNTDQHEEYTEKICLECGHRFDRIITKSWIDEYMC